MVVQTDVAILQSAMTVLLYKCHARITPMLDFDESIFCFKFEVDFKIPKCYLDVTLFYF